jgi:hypothetical protein
MPFLSVRPVLPQMPRTRKPRSCTCLLEMPSRLQSATAITLSNVPSHGCRQVIMSRRPRSVPGRPRGAHSPWELRGWAGRDLLPKEWACDVAATYLTLRLEAAQRHTGVALIAPALPLLPVA